jgi:hypothetical protein
MRMTPVVDHKMLRIWVWYLMTLSLYQQTGAEGAKAPWEILGQAKAMKDWLVSVRRELHQSPETMFEEHNTSVIVRRYLDSMKVSYRLCYL